MRTFAGKVNILALLAILFMLLGVVLTVFAVLGGFDIFTRADPTLEPKNIIVSNQTSSSVTVTFITPDKATSAFIKYGAAVADLNLSAFDTQGSQAQSTLHFITLDSLQANTSYYYKIYVNGVEFANAGNPWQTKSFKVTATPSLPETLSGEVSPVTQNCLVYAHLIDGSITSTTYAVLTSSNGSFIIDSNSFKNKTSEDIYTIGSNTRLLTFVICPDGSRSGKVSDPREDIGTLQLQNNFAVRDYNNTLTVITGQAADTSIPATNTPVPTTGPSRTPTPTARPVTPTTVSTANASPVPTATVLPATDLSDYNSIIWGIILIFCGFILRNYIFYKKKKNHYGL